MRKNDELDKLIDSSMYIACICEGGAEKTILRLLLENEMLKFDFSKLLDGEIINERNPKKFESRYLRKEFSGKILIIRFLDSRGEARNFKLSKAYEDKVKVINVITAPEIEMFVIHKEGKYASYQNKKSQKNQANIV